MICQPSVKVYAILAKEKLFIEKHCDILPSSFVYISKTKKENTCVVNPFRNTLSSLEICCNFGKEIYCFPLQKYSAILAKKYIVINGRNIVKFWQKNIYCHPLQIYVAILAKKFIVIPCRNMVQFRQRNILSFPAEICCNFGKEIYCHPLQKYVAILAVADFPEGPPLDKGNFGQSDKNVFLLNRTFLHFQLNFFRGLQKEVLKYSCDKQYIACT